MNSSGPPPGGWPRPAGARALAGPDPCPPLSWRRTCAPRIRAVWVSKGAGEGLLGARLAIGRPVDETCLLRADEGEPTPERSGILAPGSAHTNRAPGGEPAKTCAPSAFAPQGTLVGGGVLRPVEVGDAPSPVSGSDSASTTRRAMSSCKRNRSPKRPWHRQREGGLHELRHGAQLIAGTQQRSDDHSLDVGLRREFLPPVPRAALRAAVAPERTILASRCPNSHAPPWHLAG